MKITSIDQIEKYYNERFSKKSPDKIGVEWERFGVQKDTEGNFFPTPYIDGYEKILQTMAQKNGWKIIDEYDGYPFTLKKGSTLITTEGDGKPEISGSPFEDLHEVFDELENISSEIEKISHPMGITWVESGLQPYNCVSQIPLAPKPRYQTFLKIADERGYKKWMQMYMKAVSGVHINIDVDNTNDLLQKMQTCFRIAPLLCGIFANAPMEKGEKLEVVSVRRRKILCEKCERSKMMPGILSENFSLNNWIQWYADQDMIVILRGKKTIIAPKNFTFRDWMSEGFEGEYPTIEDFDIHLKTMWVDIRFRPGYLEFRPLDTLPIPFLKGAVALFTGVLYSEEGYSLAQNITKNWKEEEYEKIHKIAWEKGIHAEYNGVNFLQAGKKLLALAEQTLLKRGKGEEKFLESVHFLLENKTTPAEIFLREQ